jgi:hypothetical protein
MYAIKEELDHLEENFTEIIQIFLSKSSDQDPRTIIPDPDPIWPKITGFITLYITPGPHLPEHSLRVPYCIPATLSVEILS